MEDKYIVEEIQKNNGKIATIITTHSTFNSAKNKYHTVLAAAALSSVDVHSANIQDEYGVVIEYESFRHTDEVGNE